MKAYYYTEAEAGRLAEIYSLRFDGVPWVTRTTDPSEADVFVITTQLYEFGYNADLIRALPHWEGNGRRHAVMNLSEDCTPLPLEMIAIRYDNSRAVKEANPLSFTLPAPCDDLGYWSDAPPVGFCYDVTFRGCHREPEGKAMIRSVEESDLSLDVAISPGNEFWPYIQREDPPLAQQMQIDFLQGLHYSRLSLCPQNRKGQFRYRFYEAMSAGRVPVWQGDDCILPMQDRIDWYRCSIQIKDADVDRTGDILKWWLNGHNDARILEMGAYGRMVWEKWLWRDNWELFCALVVRDALEGMGWNTR